jgi:phospholipase C
MDNRREFMKKAALLSGSAAFNLLPPVIQKALAIDPAPGSTFYDAEHIVFLMQENRSFDHIFGTLQGVRGYNDPRVIELPGAIGIPGAARNKVWLQSTKEGDTYAPFHLDVRDTKVAWMGSLPHNWTDQTDARNEGRYDRWLEVKKARNKDYAEMPLTMGYCTREDFPFYYSLADAFTVCDQHFCSSITGTHPNRYYWMTGTIREANQTAAKAHVWNITNYDKPELGWKTFPERLEENGISWKIYQNELTMGYGLNGEESEWLSNFGINVMEFFRQYNTRLHPGGMANLGDKKERLQQQIDQLANAPASDDSAARKLAAVRKLMSNMEADQARYTREAYDALSPAEKALNGKAFVINDQDPYFHELTPLSYDDKGTVRELNIPKGDVFHQFRKDVESGALPTVSWLMPPGNFSDHPGEPWFGPWYVSEVMEILLKNPEVWKKTIFILTYDENDGYFDHVPPFVVPNPYREDQGKVSAGLDPKMDFATKDQQTNPSASTDHIREASIGLGYRVPMVVASPWTRGGYVDSEVFDHTSSLQFLETYLAKKLNKAIRDENITEWRRTICGDLTSVFRPYNGERIKSPVFPDRDHFIEGIHQTQFKGMPSDYKKLSAEEIALINRDPLQSPYFPRQEKGIRPANALPYELYVNGQLDKTAQRFGLSFTAGKTVFGSGAAGAPFYVYAVRPYRGEEMGCRNYAVKAGDTLSDEWALADFEGGRYHLRVYGPNGFYREFMGEGRVPVTVWCDHEPVQGDGGRLTGNVRVMLTNHDSAEQVVRIMDNSYGGGGQERRLAPGGTAGVVVETGRGHNWYDFSVSLKGDDLFGQRYAGRVETGRETKTDPLMGGAS